jgi:hypothetical protein
MEIKKAIGIGIDEVGALSGGEKALLGFMGFVTGMNYAAGAWKLGLLGTAVTGLFAYAAFQKSPRRVDEAVAKMFRENPEVFATLQKLVNKEVK